MAWDNVPWFVGGGAEHSPEVARLLAFAATGGAEGVVGVNDLKVKALPVPGGAVTIDVGAALVLDRTSGLPSQTYAARMATQDQISIAPTGSAGARSDLIVARIEDPYVAGAPWQDPANPKTGPYVFTRVIPNVPAGTTSVRALNLGYSAIPLARIDLPASTGTVTSAHIKDLRKVARPRRDRQLRTYGLEQTQSDQITIFSPPSFERWPDVPFYLDVPEWATAAKVIATANGVVFPAGSSYGIVAATLGYGDPSKVTTQTVGYDSPGASQPSRGSIIVSDDVAIPTGLRGKTITCEIIAKANGGTAATQPVIDWGSSISFDVEFVEKAE